MKKALISLVFVLCILTGCSQKSSGPALDELTLSLPDNFVDMTQDEILGDGQDFLYGYDGIYVGGFQENKAELAEFFSDTSLEDYVQLVIDLNKLNCEAQETDGLWNFTYTTQVEGAEYTFICAVYETEDNFWRVQACCPTERFAENQQTMWEYVASGNIQN